MQRTLRYQALSITATMRRHMHRGFIHVQLFVLQPRVKVHFLKRQNRGVNYKGKIMSIDIHESTELITQIELG